MSYETSQWLQLTAWYLAVVAFILMLYVLLLNTRHISHRGVSAVLAVITVNLVSIGLVLDPTPVYRIGLPLYVATATSTVPVTLIVTVVLIRPEWLPRSWQSGARRLWFVVYALSTLPIVFTLVDVLWGTRLWFTPPAGYAGGFVALTTSASGTISRVLRPAITYVSGSLPILILVYLLIRDKGMPAVTRRMAWLLLVPQVTALALMSMLHGPVLTPSMALVVSALYIAAFAFAAFEQMISERRAQAGRVQTRLTALMLAIVLPLFAGMLGVLLSRADATIQTKSDESLAAASRSVAASTTTWLDLNVAALDQLVALPQIASMDAAEQKPMLEAMAAAHPHMYLVSTTDGQGMNVARNDAEALTDYSDRLWYQGAIDGAPLTFQPLIGRTTGQPALVVSTPIQREPGVQGDSGGIVGVGMFAADLADVAEQVQLTVVGKAGFSYVVDADNLVVAYPQTMPESLVAVSRTLPITPLADLSAYPPVQALRAGSRGRIEFTDEAGQVWQAYVEEMEYGWGVVVQQPDQDFASGLQGLQQVVLLFVIGGLILLVGMTVVTLRQALRPVERLTETATAIAAGDLYRVASIESEDEFGLLARAFNRMTGQLRELIGSLEQRVAERTADLERRSAYLQASADVGRAVSSILDVDDLIAQVVGLIQERFDLYYVGLFLTDPAGEWAVLRAGTGQAGRAMLARGHRIRVGEGMVGWTIANREARVAQAAERDAMRLAAPELPETRSEAALPLNSRGRVLGALTVQHVQPDIFDASSLAVFQTMADQVALALDNAQLFVGSQQALDMARRAYGEASRQRWVDLLTSRRQWAYRYADDQIVEPPDEACPEMVEAERTGRMVVGRPQPEAGASVPAVAMPIQVRDAVVGVIGFRKKAGGGEWSAEERQVLEALTGQLEVALESARLYQDTQQRAAREQVAAELTARIRESLDVDTVLQTAVRELRGALNIDRVEVRLGEPRRGDPVAGNDDGHHNG